MRTCVHELLGYVDVGLGYGGVVHGLLELPADSEFLERAQSHRDVLAQLIECLKTTGLRCELVVDLREALRLDLCDGVLELSGAPGDRLRLAVLTELALLCA